MKHETFVDTSGFYALLVKRDDMHRTAGDILHKAAEVRKRFVTTDYVLDETATLLKARGHGHLLSAFFESILASKSCRVEWTEQERFVRAKNLFLKHTDQEWSFTDCLSFCVMKELRIHDVLTKDVHFQETGFSALLV